MTKDFISLYGEVMCLENVVSNLYNITYGRLEKWIDDKMILWSSAEGIIDHVADGAR